MLTEIQLSSMKEIVLNQFTFINNTAAVERSKRFLSDRVISTSLYPDVLFDDGNLWADRDARSHERYLNGFLFFTDWYGTVLKNPDTKKIACLAASEIIRSWVAASRDPDTCARMAFHDETTAQRLISLLQLDTYMSESLPEESVLVLRPLMDETAELLADPKFHSAGNNHGMFQDLALLYYAILAEWVSLPSRNSYILLALRRLKDYFSSCFTPEGVHVENTPQYHVMVSRHLAVVKNIVEASGHIDADYYARLLAAAETYATHALMPNGMYPPISDTAQRSVNNRTFLGIFTSPEFQYAASSGRSGRAPQERFLVLPESGYVVYRSKWGDPNATYAFFSAAYNSDYHKHSDDLSLYIRSNGVELLAESGPYSYDYKDPFSRYAYSQFSHNSLIVDGRSLPRTDSRSDSVQLRLESKTRDAVTVEGTNARYEDTVHTRRLCIQEDAERPTIYVTDTVKSNDEHSYQLLWNLGAEVSAVVHGQGFELFSNGRKLMELTFTANVPTQVTVSKGRTKPRPLGWTFPSFGEAVPSEVVSIGFSGAEAEVCTTIRFADWFYADREITPEKGWKRYNGKVPVNYLFCPPASGDTTKLVVVFTAIHSPGDFTYNYKSTIDQVGVAALYILDDYGDQGAYYYSDHRSTAIFDSVQLLINQICSALNLSQENVATVGSSKGGAGALIHGLALGVDRIIVGAPQTRIGTFLKTPHTNILEFMAGGTTDDDVDYLNGIIPSLMKGAADSTRVLLVVGEADHHLKYHVKPLLKDSEAYGVDVTALVLPGLTHADIGKVFRQYLRANLEQWIRGIDEVALPYELTINSSNKTLTLSHYSAADSSHAYRLYFGSDVVQSRGYSPTNGAQFENLVPGKYRIRISSRSGGEPSPSTFTTRWVTMR
jgi:hypothetical protein